ncbi:MAG TPA: hypothetical protein VGO17_17330 [Aurantimonas sp.]|jgi:hypothetical protein|nr:hypothetical protein [Aurantimonas sp.]
MIRGLFLTLAAFAMNLIPGCDYAEWNQKMVVTVETPEGMRMGESVVNIWFTGNRALAFMDGSSVSWKATGEAVVVDLGERGVLMALLVGEEHMGDAGVNASFAFTSMYRLAAGEQETIEGVLDQPKGVPVPLPRKAYPLLVTFRDISDPTTIEQVDPDNLARSFGEGVRLNGLTLERTSEPITDRSIRQYLPCTDSFLCIPVNYDLPYGHSLSYLPNSVFKRS